MLITSQHYNDSYLQTCVLNTNTPTQIKQIRGLVMSEIHHCCPQSTNFEFSFIGKDCRPSQKSETNQNNQFSVMTRFGKLMSTETMLRLYKAFILPHFYYCSKVWYFSSKQDSDKLDLLNKHILRFIFKDFNFEYNDVLKKAGEGGGSRLWNSEGMGGNAFWNFQRQGGG